MRHIPDKTLADIVESLNGLFYVKTLDLDVCQFFLYDMGILNRPKLLVQNGKYDTDLRIQNRGNKILDNFEMLENKIGYTFNNLSNLIEAFTHYSFRSALYQVLGTYEINNFFNSIDFSKNYDKDPDYNPNLEIQKVDKQVEIETRNFDYERLETLGDSVLDLIINNFLIKNFPSSNPGDLSLMK